MATLHFGFVQRPNAPAGSASKRKAASTTVVAAGWEAAPGTGIRPLQLTHAQLRALLPLRLCNGQVAAVPLHSNRQFFVQMLKLA
jgi:hypothetical protein